MEEESATKQPLINEKIHCLDKEISRLFELVDALETRLNPILSIEPPSKSKEELFKSILSIIISNLLQTEVDNIHRLQVQIEEIQKRLEI